MFDHEYAKELVNREFDGPFMADFFSKYKNELSNVRTPVTMLCMILDTNQDNKESVNKNAEIV